MAVAVTNGCGALVVKLTRLFPMLAFLGFIAALEFHYENKRLS
jgi:hypothetical protein